MEFAISRLHQKFGSEALKIEENASIGFKARTLVLEVNKGNLKAQALMSDLLSERDRRWLAAPKAQEKKKIPEGPGLEEALLERPSFVQSKDIEVGEAALKIIHTPSYKQRQFHEKIKSHGNVPFHEICFAVTREECKKINPACTKVREYRTVSSKESARIIPLLSPFIAAKAPLSARFVPPRRHFTRGMLLPQYLSQNEHLQICPLCVRPGVPRYHQEVDLQASQGILLTHSQKTLHFSF